MLTIPHTEEETETQSNSVTGSRSHITRQRTAGLNHCSCPRVFETEIVPGPKTNLAPRMAGADDLQGPAMLHLPAGVSECHFSEC